MSWYTSGQEDQNIRYWLLGSSHGSYETRRAAIESLSPNYANVAGSVANTRVVTGYATDAEIASNSLDIGGAVLDRAHNFVNPNAAAVTIRTNEWGDKYPVWGQFLTQPDSIPTTGIDRLVQHWKDGLGNVIYIGQDNVGTGDGSSYLNRRRVKDFLGTSPTVDPTTYDIMVLCGELSRFANEGAGTFVQQSALPIKDGSSGARTQILSHPTDRAVIMAGCKHGGGGYGEDADWTDAGGGLWYIDFYGNGSNDGTINISGSPIPFAHTNAGGTRRPLTLVADATECAATPDSWFWHFDHGGADYDRVYCRLADGSNPRTTTFWPSNAGGISMRITGKGYFDVFGIEFRSSSFRATQNDHDWAFYACTFGWNPNPVFGCGAATIDEGTGDFTYDQNSNRSLIGCECSYAYAFIYDTNNGHDKVPLNTTIRDCYVHHTNLKAADAYGCTLHSVADLHAIADQGFDGRYILNNRFDYCGIQTLVSYLQPNNFTTPTGGLESTDYYTIGAPAAACFDKGDGTSTYVGKGKNLLIADNLITNPNCTGIYATDDGQGIAYQGDNNQMLGLNSQYANVKILRNRIEGLALGVSIRLTACWPDGDTDYPEIAYNVIRGAQIGFSALNTVTTAGPVTYDPSFYFHHNDVHADVGAVPLFVHLPNIANPTHHEMRLDYDTYRNDDSANWRWASNQDKTDIQDWRNDAPSGDAWDTNSTHTAFTSDTGSPSLTASGTSTLTANLGSDPDGATSSLSYQWFKNGTLITSAESATYDATGQTGAFTCVVLGTDAKGKWFLVTSNALSVGTPSGAGKAKKKRVPENHRLAPPPLRVVNLADWLAEHHPEPKKESPAVAAEKQVAEIKLAHKAIVRLKQEPKEKHAAEIVLEKVESFIKAAEANLKKIYSEMSETEKRTKELRETIIRMDDEEVLSAVLATL